MKIPGKYLTLLIALSSALFLLVYKTIIQDDFPKITDKKIEKEAYSVGRNILIHPTPWLNTEDNNSNERKYQCRNNWKFKENLDFETFIQKCPDDVEARIYLNNEIARTKANSSPDYITAQIAIVVPISGKKLEISDPKVKVNGKRVFDSIEILKGIEIAQREINVEKEGIPLGSKKVFLEVVIVDDSYIDDIKEEEKAQRVANYLGEDKNIIAVIGHFSSDSIQAAAGIYRKHKLVAFSPTSTAIRKNNNRFFSILDDSDKLKLNPYIFRTSPNDAIAIDRLINAIKYKNNTNNDSIKSAIILYEPDNNFSRLYKQGFQKQFLKSIEDAEVFEEPDSTHCQFYSNIRGDNRFHNCVNFIKEKKPDALLIVTSTNLVLEIATTILNEIKDFKHKPQLLGADNMFKERFLSETAEGMIVAVPLQSQKFKGVHLSWRGAMTYDAAKSITKAIENSKCENKINSGINNCLRKQIKNVLSDKNFQADGILGIETIFFENGDRQINDALKSELEAPLQIKKIGDSTEYQFRLLE